MVTLGDVALFAALSAALFLAAGALAWLADRPTRTDYPDRWTD